MLRAMAVPSILVAVMRGELLEKGRRRAVFGVSSNCGLQNILGGVARVECSAGAWRLQIACSLMRKFPSSQNETASLHCGAHVCVRIFASDGSANY